MTFEKSQHLIDHVEEWSNGSDDEIDIQSPVSINSGRKEPGLRGTYAGMQNIDESIFDSALEPSNENSNFRSINIE